MTLTIDTLQALGVSESRALLFIDPIKAACALYDILSDKRLAAFLGQVLAESEMLNHVEENLNYTAPRIRQVFPISVKSDLLAAKLAGNPQALANLVYAKKGGNGDVDSGDGYKYRGRGLIALTLKTNYQAASAGTSRPYVDNPDLVSQPSDAALTAAWYWSTHGCNALADTWNLDKITATVNGPAMLAKVQRATLSNKALALLST